MRSSLLTLLLPLIAACAVHGYFTVPTTVQVSPDGDDTNDGFNLPVRTLKRGLGVAAEHATITTILLDPGRYDAASGEAFPYTVPAHITIAGPAGGGVILAGTSIEPGLVIGAGELRDLELEDFAVAVTSHGDTRLTNLRVRSSETAIRGDAAARLTVTNLEIIGTASPCLTGVELTADAALTASGVSTRDLGTAFDIKDQTTASISKAVIAGNGRCTEGASFEVATTKTFALDDSIVDGSQYGISFYGAATSTTATLTRTTISNMRYWGILGTRATLTITGGEFLNNTRPLSANGGVLTLKNVTFKQNAVDQVNIEGISPTTLTMHGCTFTDYWGDGVYLGDYAVADLGTNDNPGNNTFLANTDFGYGYGLNIAGLRGARFITAVGNTWLPNVQGSDAAGKYVQSYLPGPVDPGEIGNFAIAMGWVLGL